MMKPSGLMMGGGMAAMCVLMCGAPLLLAAGAGSVLWGAVAGAGGWLAAGLALAVVAGVLLVRQRRARTSKMPSGAAPENTPAPHTSRPTPW